MVGLCWRVGRNWRGHSWSRRGLRCLDRPNGGRDLILVNHQHVLRQFEDVGCGGFGAGAGWWRDGHLILPQDAPNGGKDVLHVWVSGSAWGSGLLRFTLAGCRRPVLCDWLIGILGLVPFSYEIELRRRWRLARDNLHAGVREDRAALFQRVARLWPISPSRPTSLGRRRRVRWLMQPLEPGWRHPTYSSALP
jgi:hypothetical protein